MKCEQFESRWQQLMDERRPPCSDPHLVAHTLKCENCADLMDAAERMLLGVSTPVNESVAEDFAYRVVRAAREPVAPPVRPVLISDGSGASVDTVRDDRKDWTRRFLAPAVASLVVATLLTVSMGSFMLRSKARDNRLANRTPANGTLAQTPIGARAMALPSQPSNRANQPKTDVAAAPKQPTAKPQLDGSFSTSLSHFVVVKAVDFAATDNRDLRGMLANLAQRLPRDQAAKTLNDRLLQLNSATRPITKSFGNAIHAIYRSVGNSGEAAPEKSAQQSARTPHNLA